MTYVILDPAGHVYRRVSELVPVAEAKGYRLLSEIRPDHDPATQALVPPVEPVPAEATEYLWEVRARTTEELAAELAAAKAAAIIRINREAGEQRARYITVTPGQEGTYLEKRDEARRVLAGEAGPSPYLEAEAAAVGVTVAELAATVSATADAWTAVNARIEGRRKAAGQSVATAASMAEVDAVFPISWEG